MKHLVHNLCCATLIGLCTLFALPTMAQYYNDNEYAYGESNSFRNRQNYVDYSKMKKCYKNIRLGANTSSVSNTGTMGFGYDASLAFIFPNRYLYFMTEAGLSMRRCDYADLVDFDHHPAVGNFREVRFDAVGHNIKLRPVQLGTMINAGGLGIDIHAGCFASYDYVQNTMVDSWSSYKPEYDTLPEQNRFDYGINVGLGFYFARFNMDFTYEHGFADFFKSYTSKSNMTTFRFGFLF